MAQDYSPFEMAIGAFVIGCLVLLGIFVYLLWPVIVPAVIGIAWYVWWHKGPVGTESRLQDEQRLLKGQVDKSLGQRKLPEPDDFVAELMQALKESRRCPHLNILLKLYNVTGELYATEINALGPPPEKANSIDGARWRTEARAFIAKAGRPDLVETIRSTILDAYTWFADRLPDSAVQTEEEVNEAADAVTDGRAPTQFLLPLPELLAKPGVLVNELIMPFFQSKADGLFVGLRKQLDANLTAVRAKEHDAFPDTYPGADPVTAYLAGTPFAAVFDAALPFAFPQHLRFEGQWIVAPPGRGKTTLLSALFAEDLHRDASIIVIDSKGDLINPIRRLKALEHRLVILEPDPNFPLALNPLDISKQTATLNGRERDLRTMRVVSHLEQLFSGLFEAKMTALQSRFFRIVLRSIVTAAPAPTLATLRNICQSGYEGLLDLTKLSEEDRTFFLKEFKSKTYSETSNQILWRLGLLLDDPVFRAMFTAPATKVDMGALMDSRKVILINNSKALLDDAGAEFFGRFFLTLIRAAAQQRARLKDADKVPVFFYIDECQSVISRDDNIATIIDECRSQKIALLMAHQRVAQIANPNVLDALSNCAIRFANSDEDARYLAPRFFVEPEFMRQPRGSFAAFVRDITPSAIALRVPNIRLQDLNRMTKDEYQGVLSSVRSRYCYSPDEVPERRDESAAREPPPHPRAKPSPQPAAEENTGPTTNY